jgi:hypothetical protein
VKSTIKILSCLKCGLASWRCVRLNHGGGLLVGELASPWCYPLLGGGLPSTGLCVPPSVISVMSLIREVSFWLWYHRPWGNYHRGLSGWSVLHPLCGCDGSEQSPHAMPWGRLEAESPLPTRCREDFLGGVLHHGPLSHPVFKRKTNAHSMCAQESGLHTYHTENGYRITNITNILYLLHEYCLT